MSRLDRWARLGGLTSRVAGKVLDGRVRELLSPAHVREKAREALQARTAEEVVKTLAQLKGAAMKVGQQLSLVASQLDLPEEVQRTLSTLHASAEPVPYPVVRAAVEASLERPLTGAPGAAFARFDPSPLGTASLGQAHAATLPDGAEVVVKVLHEGVAEGLEADLLALRGMLHSGRVFGRDKAEIEDIYDEIATHLRLELDYLQEAANLAEFARLYEGDPRFALPEVFPSHCTERVITMTRVPGRPLAEFLTRAGPEARQVAGEHLVAWFFESTFRHQLLHADPHPGNFLFSDDGRLGVLDFGCVKRFDEFFLGSYAKTVLAALDDDRDGTLQACLELGVWRGADPGAAEAIWAFCDAVVAPWRTERPTTLGEEDDLVARAAPAARQLWKYPEIRGAKDMVYLHRTLGGLYTLGRQLRTRGRWSEVLRTHLQGSIDRAEGRA